jgi:hypothetical protein
MRADTKKKRSVSVYGGRVLALQLGRDDRQNKLTLEICWGYWHGVRQQKRQ